LDSEPFTCAVHDPISLPVDFQDFPSLGFGRWEVSRRDFPAQSSPPPPPPSYCCLFSFCLLLLSSKISKPHHFFVELIPSLMGLVFRTFPPPRPEQSWPRPSTMGFRLTNCISPTHRDPPLAPRFLRLVLMLTPPLLPMICCGPLIRSSPLQLIGVAPSLSSIVFFPFTKASLSKLECLRFFLLRPSHSIPLMKADHPVLFLCPRSSRFPQCLQDPVYQ